MKNQLDYTRFDLNFADFIARLQGTRDPDLLLAARLLAGAERRRETALELDAVAWSAPDIAGRLLSFDQVVSTAGGTPLVLNGNRLYLERFYAAEAELAAALRLRAGRRPDFDPAAAGRVVESLFTADAASFRQRLAVFAALRGNLAIVSGGPGTGKTYTAARILAARRQLYGEEKISLAAPTGKAAALLSEALREAGTPGLEECRGVTIHRLLGYRPGAAPRHRPGNPLDSDILLIDEVSMVPLLLLARLFAALPPETAVVLLGDMYQLSSVEPGCVFADLCAAAAPEAFSTEFRADYAAAFGAELPASPASAAPPLADAAVELVHSRRFDAGGVLAEIARRTNEVEREADADAVLHLIAAGGGDFAAQAIVGHRGPGRGLRALIEEAYAPLAAAATVEEAFAALDAFRLLTATRVGPYGSVELNRLARKLLFPAAEPAGPFRRQPLIVLENHYHLGLFNGDIGVVFDDGDGRLAAWFPERAVAEGAAYRRIPLPLLPACEEVFAMTVHKSQGSEFDRAALVIPPGAERLNRELFYTGITRAKRRVELFYEPDSLRGLLLRRSKRTSGLGERLISPKPD